MNETELLAEILPQLQALGASHEANWIINFVNIQTIDADEAGALARKIVARRALHEPLAYIFGEWSFRTYEIAVGPGVLIPRPETEELVEIILSASPRTPRKIVDCGAGSGCLGLALAADFSAINPEQKIALTLIENSPVAQKWLEKNIERLRPHLKNVDVEIVPASWTTWRPTNKYDLVVANPPYLTTDELKTCDDSVTKFEPIAALLPENISIFPDASGPYREIIEVAEQCLLPGGWLWFELGLTQPKWIQNYVAARGTFTDLALRKDMSNKVRFFGAHRSGDHG